MAALRLGAGGHLQLGELLARGGEGRIHGVTGDSTIVVKLYQGKTLDRSGDLGARLRAMITNPPSNPTQHLRHQSLAWPTDTVHTPNGDLAGFVMPRLDIGRCAELHQIANPSDRANPQPPIPGWVASRHWDYLVRVAANLASAVAALHDAGYVVGDLNERNAIVTNRALVSLVDCDSMQVPNPDGSAFLCRVGVPRFTAPELHGADLRKTTRRPSSDGFALAVLIFQLLMQGGYPFDGVWRGPGDRPPRTELVRQGIYANAGHPHLAPRPHAPPFQVLPPDIQRRFTRAFTSGATAPDQRPTAATWHDALEELANNLKPCPRNQTHIHSSHLDTCPWCTERAPRKAPPAPRLQRHQPTHASDDVRRRPTPPPPSPPEDPVPPSRLTTGDKITTIFGTLQLLLLQVVPWHRDVFYFLFGWELSWRVYLALLAYNVVVLYFVSGWVPLFGLSPARKRAIVFAAHAVLYLFHYEPLTLAAAPGYAPATSVGFITNVWPAWAAYLTSFAVVSVVLIRKLVDNITLPDLPIGWNQAIFLATLAVPALLLLKLALLPSSISLWAAVLIAVGVGMAYGGALIVKEPPIAKDATPPRRGDRQPQSDKSSAAHDSFGRAYQLSTGEGIVAGLGALLVLLLPNVPWRLVVHTPDWPYVPYGSAPERWLVEGLVPALIAYLVTVVVVAVVLLRRLADNLTLPDLPMVWNHVIFPATLAVPALLVLRLGLMPVPVSWRAYLLIAIAVGIAYGGLLIAREPETPAGIDASPGGRGDGTNT